MHCNWYKTWRQHRIKEKLFPSKEKSNILKENNRHTRTHISFMKLFGLSVLMLNMTVKNVMSLKKMQISAVGNSLRCNTLLILCKTFHSVWHDFNLIYDTVFSDSGNPTTYIIFHQRPEKCKYRVPLQSSYTDLHVYSCRFLEWDQYCCNSGNWGQCCGIFELRSVLADNNLISHYHNNDLGYNCCLWYQCCIFYSFWVRVI